MSPLAWRSIGPLSLSTRGPVTSRPGGSMSARRGVWTACPSPPRCSPSAAFTAPASRSTSRRSSATARLARCAYQPRPIRWVFHDREGSVIRDSIVRLSSFGTAAQTLRLGNDLPLGTYKVTLQVKRGTWQDIANTNYRVAEDRPPEFLVTVTADSAPRFNGDSLYANVEARYLFGAPMARALVNWTLNVTPGTVSGLNIPGVDRYYLGENGWWWEEWEGNATRSHVSTTSSGI